MRWSAPSERNYAIFCSIEFESRSLREVAAEFGISVVRVQQILAQVRKWFVANVPAWSRELEPVLQPLVAHDIFEHKLQHLTRQTMAAFGATQGEQTVKCQKLDVLQATGGGWSRTRISGGEPKYIALGVRLAKVQLEAAMKVAQWRLDHKEEEAAALAKYADLPPYMTLAEHEQELRAEAAETPCARQVEKSTAETEADIDAEMLTDDEDETYRNEIAPLEFGSSLLSPPVRSRKERRRRAKLLERALGRKKAK